MALSDVKVRSAKPEAKAYKLTDGEGMVLLVHPTRWCSDGFEIRCWNREVVLVVFSLDCCDREAICWSATTGGISSVFCSRKIGHFYEGHFIFHGC
ncbi:hypothetical protein BDE27_2914 [Xenorhabdus ehlersii]|uniref:Integrase n=1 Tax=Xenorhabdus ehlersii TaxID=290111 RepID=A0A2D0IMW1_9GAMM|nr:Arm DNA-binding domain-containing protein [Xenorhabdus ehlersii]PHM23173.1 integrase [Xenorhabdus ehlersii]RKE89282.1 hypothetical protein BDE27_2914 [Xenorhabdus ehlersii]